MNSAGKVVGSVQSLQQALNLIFGGRTTKLILQKLGAADLVLQLADGDLRALGASEKSIELFNAAKFLKFQPLAESIKSSNDSYSYFEHLQHSDHESFWMLCLDRKNAPIGEAIALQLTEGGRASSIVDVNLLTRKALIRGSFKVIIAHNHPSGNLTASQADKVVTKEVKAGLKLLEIQLIDHLIIARNGYLSFADEGYL